MIVAIWRSLWHLSVGKILTSFFTFSLIDCQDVVNLFFWVLSALLAMHTQTDTNNLEKTFVFICWQKPNFIPHAFLDICKGMQTSYFGYSVHAWLHKPKTTASTCKKTLMIICMQKINFIIHFFLEIFHFKESCNFIGWQHFGM